MTARRLQILQILLCLLALAGLALTLYTAPVTLVELMFAIVAAVLFVAIALRLIGQMLSDLFAQPRAHTTDTVEGRPVDGA